MLKNEKIKKGLDYTLKLCIRHHTNKFFIWSVYFCLVSVQVGTHIISYVTIRKFIEKKPLQLWFFGFIINTLLQQKRIQDNLQATLQIIITIITKKKKYCSFNLYKTKKISTYELNVKPPTKKRRKKTRMIQIHSIQYIVVKFRLFLFLINFHYLI